MDDEIARLCSVLADAIKSRSEASEAEFGKANARVERAAAEVLISHRKTLMVDAVVAREAFVAKLAELLALERLAYLGDFENPPNIDAAEEIEGFAERATNGLTAVGRLHPAGDSWRAAHLALMIDADAPLPGDGVAKD